MRYDLSALTGGLGTFQFMAPQVTANQRYLVKADESPFGMVLWECTAQQVRKAVPLSYRSAASVYDWQNKIAWEGSVQCILCDAEVTALQDLLSWCAHCTSGLHALLGSQLAASMALVTCAVPMCRCPTPG